MKEVFLDAAYVIALSSPKDQYHHRAKLIAEQLEIDGTRMITTRAVILEIGNALSKLQYRRAAIELLSCYFEINSMSYTSVCRWLLCYGYYLLIKPKPKRTGDWVFINDFSIQLGNKKVY